MTTSPPHPNLNSAPAAFGPPTEHQLLTRSADQVAKEQRSNDFQLATTHRQERSVPEQLRTARGQHLALDAC